ncbi:MAG: ABC transporter permease [Oscillibacter sp.]|nr:ABC transporter permease [Oscillibacter sp.]
MGIFVFLCIWYIATKSTTLGKVMPDPVTVFGGFFTAFVEPIGTKTMTMHILISLRRMLVPYAIGGFTGVLIGILMGWYKVADAIFMPYIQMLRPIPPIAWIPLSIIWFGFDEGSKYFLIFLACFFTIALTTYNGVHSVDETLVRASRMLGANDRQLFMTIVLPTTVPYIFSGLQVALGSAWATIVAAEMIRSSEGVGWLIVRGQDIGNMTQIMIGIVAIALTGLLITTLMRVLENKLCAWTVRGK